DSANDLYVADGTYVREFGAPISNGEQPTRTFGDGHGAPACAQGNEPPPDAQSLCFPNGLAVRATGTLYVADTYFSRVVRYDNPLSSDSSADQVFGQAGKFNTYDCAANVSA